MPLCSLFPKVAQSFVCARFLRFYFFKSMTNNLAKTPQADSLTKINALIAGGNLLDSSKQSSWTRFCRMRCCEPVLSYLVLFGTLISHCQTLSFEVGCQKATAWEFNMGNGDTRVGNFFICDLDQHWRCQQSTFQANCREHSITFPHTSASKPYLTLLTCRSHSVNIYW